nr:MAG TPA: hypothetical protein [Bacteriophage sp.]DAM13250.1 MAG TPA: hypothetical protein [Bacteriophage sp.]
MSILIEFFRVSFEFPLEELNTRLCLLCSITYNPRADYNVCPYFL